VEKPHNPPVSPTDTEPQQLIPSLDRTWLIGQEDYKPDCCVPLDECGDTCNPGGRIGWIRKYPNYKNFNSDPDGYIRYWLAWEKANPCCYRAGANCMGAALEVSYLHTRYGNWEATVLTNRYLRSDDGYGDVERWFELVKKGYFQVDYDRFRLKYQPIRGPHIPLSPAPLLPGDIITYEPGFVAGLFKDPIPDHMVVVTKHNANGQLLCFEKQSRKGYYQLKDCDNRGAHKDWVGELGPVQPVPGFYEVHYTPNNGSPYLPINLKE
jgi:hypothetical protein